MSDLIDELNSSLDWLELDSIPVDLYNPLLDYPVGHIPNPVDELIGLITNQDYLHFVCKEILNFEPLPFQCVILDMFWRKRLPMLVMTRGGGKTSLLAVYALLRMMLNPGCKIVLVGGAFRQSRQIHEYMTDIWNEAPILRDIAGKNKRNGPRREIDRCEFRIGKSVCIAIPLGCLEPETMVTTNEGIFTIKELKEKEYSCSVYGHQKFRDMGFFYDSGVAPSIRVKTNKGYEFCGTPNHKMKIVRDEKIKWIRTDQMQLGDKILVDRSSRWHNNDIDASVKDCYCVGLMIGDGNYTNKYYLRWTEQPDELIRSINSIGNFVPEKDFKHYNMCGIKKVKNWLDYWGLKHSRHDEKFIPPTMLKASKEKMAACIRGIFDTDGTLEVEDDPRGGTSITVSFCTTAPVLARQVHYILLHFGIVSHLSSRIRESRVSKKKSRIYELLITGEDVMRFHEEISFDRSNKKLKLEEGINKKTRFNSVKDVLPNCIFNYIKSNNPSVVHCRKSLTQKRFNKFRHKIKLPDELTDLINPDIFYDEITSVQEELSKPMYDINIPDGNEYCANGFYSHNTGDKIRGLRANYILADEFSSIDEAIFNVVVQGFGVVAAAPDQKVKEAALVKKLRSDGLWTEEMDLLRKSSLGGNQIVYSGTAGYSFQHFAKYFEKWHSIIASKGRKDSLDKIMDQESFGSLFEGFDWKDYSIARVPYTEVPEGLLDPGMLAQAKATLNTGEFLREFCATFPKDSSGFYKRSIIDSVTANKPIRTPSGKTVQFTTLRQGEEDRRYVMGIDPAADQDNAAIVVLELRDDHRRVVHCWTTNKRKYQVVKKYLKGRGEKDIYDYYRFIARKVKDLMQVFNIEHIIMDKHGGGTAIAEALSSKDICKPGEYPIFEIIDPDNPKPADMDEGVHILELLVPTSDINSEANHGMLKDFQDKVLLFPKFDTIEVAKSLELDKLNNIKFDTYEELAEEIEELKNELCIIELSSTSILGQEKFDTPSIKGVGQKKGRLRKDRYSALLYANYYSRNRDKKQVGLIQYTPVGGTKETRKFVSNKNQGMYTGFGVAKFANNKDWVQSGKPRFIKRNR